MSTASDNRVKVNSEWLKERISKRGISLRELSKKVGHDPSWLSQRMNGKAEFAISYEEAQLFTSTLACRIEDFRAIDEVASTPIMFNPREEFLAKYDKLSADQYPLVKLFFDYLFNADSQKLVELDCFLRGKNTFSMESHFRFDPNLKPEQWFQAYVTSETHIVFHNELCERLKKYPSIPDENALHDVVNRKREDAKHLVSNRGDITPKTVELITEYLRKEIFGDLKDGINLDILIGNTVNRVLQLYAQFLVIYFTNCSPREANIVSAIKEQLGDVNVPCSGEK